MAEYYKAYDERYKKVAAGGAGTWGTSENDATVIATLEKWVDENSLSGKSVLQCACGEGSEGIILSKLGCLYWGTDVSLTAVSVARRRLEEYSGARIFFMDMVKNQIAGKYDGILDCQGLHMLVTDDDRRKYLENLYFALKDGASALFMRELYDENAFPGEVDSFEEWQKITGADYETPEERTVIPQLRILQGFSAYRHRFREARLYGMREAGRPLLWLSRSELRFRNVSEL